MTPLSLFKDRFEGIIEDVVMEYIDSPPNFKRAMERIITEYGAADDVFRDQAEDLMCYYLSKLGYGEGAELFREHRRNYV